MPRSEPPATPAARGGHAATDGTSGGDGARLSERSGRGRTRDCDDVASRTCARCTLAPRPRLLRRTMTTTATVATTATAAATAAITAATTAARPRPTGKGGGGHGDGGTTVGWKNPNRPGQHCGTSTGQVPGGSSTRATSTTPPWNEWPRPRARPLPAVPVHAGQRRRPGRAAGRRRRSGRARTSCCWPGVDPAVAPTGAAGAGPDGAGRRSRTRSTPTSGTSASPRPPNVVVEFYWCDPALGIGPRPAHT